MTFSDPESQDDQLPDEDVSGIRHQLERQIKETKRLEAELSQRDRDLAFSKVGLPDTPIAEFFRNNYTGDPTEEAVRSEASALGLIGGTSQEVTSQVDTMDQMAESFSGGTSPLPETQQEEMEAKMRAIRPGPNYSKDMENLLQSYGRPTAYDAT